MRGRFKKCLASIMAVLMMCSVYVVPAGAAGAEPTQDEGEWDNILWSPNGSSRESQGLCYYFSVDSLPKGASVKWTVDEDSSKYDVEWVSGSTGSSTTDGVSNANVLRVNSPVYDPRDDHQFKITVKVYDKNKNLKRTFEQTLGVYTDVAVTLTPPEDVDLNAMELGTYRFTAEKAPSKATTSIYYTLQNADGTPVSESAASVDENGNVTLKAPGTYTLKAESKSTAGVRSSLSDSITFTCDPKYFIEQKEGGTVPASIKVGDTLSLVLVREIEDPPVIKLVEMPPAKVEYIQQNGIINKGQAAKPIYAIEANGLPTEGDIRISTREKNIFETVIGNTEASGVQWSNDSGPYEYEVVESLDIKEIVENTELEGSLQAVGEDQSGNNAQSGNDAQSGENGQPEDDVPSAGSARDGNTSGSEGAVKSGETGDSYYIGVGNSATAGTGLDFVATRTGVAYEWTASNDCVTIGSDGVLKGIKPGTVEITGAYKDYDNDVEGSVSVELEVKEQKLEAVKNDQAEGDETPGNDIGIPSVDNTDEKPVIEVKPTPAPAPTLEISGPDEIILAPGYNTALYNFAVVTLEPIQTCGVKVENEEENYKYKFDLVERIKNVFKISILPGLPNGTKIPLTIWASVKGENGTDKYVEKAVIVQVSENAPSAGILGGNSITLEEGYAPAQYNYNLSGEPSPTVRLETVSNTANAILENGAVTIPQGLTEGEYYFTLLAENDKGKASKKVKVIVTPKKEAPQITGEDTISLDAGYGQPVPYEYSVTGYPEAEVRLLEAGNTAKAVMADGKVTIPQDLGVGSYSFTFQAENSEGKATKTVTVNVYEKPQITGLETVYLDEGYSSVPYEYNVTGYPEPAVSILADDNTAKATLTNGQVTIASGLGVGQHTFTLQAENAAGTATKTVTVNVSPRYVPVAPQIYGDDTIPLEAGYAETEYTYSISGDPWPTVSLSEKEGSNTANAKLENGKVIIPAGLVAGPEGASEYSFTLVAENSVGKVTKPVTINVSSPVKEPIRPSISGPTEIHCLASAGGSYSYEITGDQPMELNLLTRFEGASLQGKSLIVKGGLTASASPYDVTLAAKNEAGEEQLQIKIYLYDDISSSNILTEATANKEFHRQLTAQGGIGGYTYTKVGGEFPNGLTLSQGGVIAGTPRAESEEASGYYTASVKVTDQQGNTATFEVKIWLTVPTMPMQSAKPVILAQNGKNQRNKPADKDTPVKEPVEQEEDFAKEPVKKEAESTKEELEKQANPTKSPAGKEADSTKEPAKEEGATKEPAVKDENPKQEPEK